MSTETIITNRRNKNDTYRWEMLLPGTYRFFVVRLAAHVSNGCKSQIRPVVGRI